MKFQAFLFHISNLTKPFSTKYLILLTIILQKMYIVAQLINNTYLNEKIITEFINSFLSSQYWIASSGE